MRYYKLTILLIFVLATLLSVSGCGIKPVANQNQNVNQSENTNQSAEKSTYTLTKDADGWKTYTDYNFGIRFKYKDEKNIYLFNISDNTIRSFSEKTKEPVFFRVNKYNYKYIVSSNYNSFKEYLEREGWATSQMSFKLISLEKFNYPNLDEIYLTRATEGDMKGSGIYIVEHYHIKIGNVYIRISRDKNAPDIIEQILNSLESINK